MVPHDPSPPAFRRTRGSVPAIPAAHAPLQPPVGRVRRRRRRVPRLYVTKNPFPSAGTLVYSNVNGIRNGPTMRMWLQNLQCSGTERNLMACEYDTLVDRQCDPYWAAAVLCGGGWVGWGWSG